ncbi:MAG: hypothetical protein JWM11_3612 [Planctomycetaceae bacterium]|nr:hypothetical protein [Planctomycetaceae bacterium]
MFTFLSNKRLLSRNLLLLAVLFLTGCGTRLESVHNSVLTDPNANSKVEVKKLPTKAVAKPAAVEIPDRPKPEQVIVLTLPELGDALKADSQLTKYQSSAIEVSLTVPQIDLSSAAITSHPSPKRKTEQITFAINSIDPQPWARIAPGQRVKLCGWDAKLLGKYKWDVVEVGPNPAPIVTAQALAAEFLRDGVIAAQKYYDHPIYVTGKVLERIRDRKSKRTILTLQGEGRMNVIVDYTLETDTFEEFAQAGNVMHLLAKVGVFNELNFSTGRVELFTGMPITVPFPDKNINYVDSIESRIRDQVSQMRSLTPDFKLTMEQLRTQIQDNFQNASKKYEAALVELSGTIKSFRSGELGDYIVLDFGDGTNAIDCRMLESEPWKPYVLGQKVSARGRFRLFQVPLILNDCLVVSSEPVAEGRKEFAVDELVSHCLNDQGSGSVSFRDKPVEVYGTIEAFDEFAPGFQLKGANGYSIACQFPNPYSKTINPYRARFLKHAVGDHVRIQAKFDSHKEGLKVIHLSDAWERQSGMNETAKPSVQK